MYVVTYTNQGKIKNEVFSSVKNALNEKRIHENRKELAVVWNRTFPDGIQKIKYYMNLWLLDKLDFIQSMDMVECIENIEGSLL